MVCCAQYTELKHRLLIVLIVTKQKSGHTCCQSLSVTDCTLSLRPEILFLTAISMVTVSSVSRTFFRKESDNAVRKHGLREA